MSKECAECRGRVNEYVEEYQVLKSQMEQKNRQLSEKIEHIAPILPMYPLPEGIQQLQKDMEKLRRGMEVISVKAMGFLIKMKQNGCKI